MDIYGYLKAENGRLSDLIETIVESTDRALQDHAAGRVPPRPVRLSRL
ncbi:MAG: hypothetical protein WDN06_16770 [Asticcacaulis sp.]